MTKLTVVINTLNEEKNLPRAVASVNGLADEVVVVDMKSTDNTKAVAKKLGAIVYEHEQTNYVEPARNFALQQAQCEWVLVLDADEEISDTLKKEIKRIITNPGSADYYRLPRKNIIFGKWIKHSLWWPDHNIRLFKKGCVSWSEIIHSVPTTKGRGLDFPENEELAIIHHHYETVDQYLERLNRYTTIYANQLVKDGYAFNWRDILNKPMAEFLNRYFFGKGYADGLHGLVLSLLQAFSELVVYLKVWQVEKFEEKNPAVEEIITLMKESNKELYYWQADTLYKKSGSFIQKIKRKLRLL